MPRDSVFSGKWLLYISVVFWTLGSLQAGIPRSVHYFAQVGEGAGFRTIFLVENSNLESVEFTLELFSDEGAPLELALAGSRVSRLERTLGPREALRLAGDGSGDAILSGWAKLTANRSVGAQVFFEIFQEGRIVTQAAVESTAPLRSARAFLQVEGEGQTGFAVASLSTTGSVRVTVRATSSQGTELGTAELILPPLGHQARFLPQLIAELGTVEVGTIEIRSSGPVAITILQQTGLVIGSLPVIL